MPFIKALNSPVVLANVNDTVEPDMQGLYKKSLIIDRFGRKIGIIGLILSTVDVSIDLFDVKNVYNFFKIYPLILSLNIYNCPIFIKIDN